MVVIVVGVIVLSFVGDLCLIKINDVVEVVVVVLCIVVWCVFMRYVCCCSCFR